MYFDRSEFGSVMIKHAVAEHYKLDTKYDLKHLNYCNYEMYEKLDSFKDSASLQTFVK